MRRRQLTVLGVAAVASACLPGGALGSSASVRPASRAALDRRGGIAGGAQGLREAWPAGASTVWAWTAKLSGQGAQAVQLSPDGGDSWIGVTPPGLGEQVGDRVISGFSALDAAHAWVVYGPVASGAAQSIVATSDGGRRWRVVNRLPSRDGCALQFVTPDDGWCTAIGAALGSETVTLYRTRDGGLHWRVVSKTLPGPNVAGSLPFGCDKSLQFVNASVGWATFGCAGGVSPLYETLDGGASWIRRSVAAPAGGVGGGGSGFSGTPVLAGGDGAVGYTIPSPKPRSVIYSTRDSGASWQAVIPPGAPRPWLVDIVTPMRWRLVAGDRILATDDAGRSWHAIATNLNVTTYSPYASPAPAPVDFASSTTGWIVGQTQTEWLWRTTDGGHTWRRIPVPGT